MSQSHLNPLARIGDVRLAGNTSESRGRAYKMHEEEGNRKDPAHVCRWARGAQEWIGGACTGEA